MAAGVAGVAGVATAGGPSEAAVHWSDLAEPATITLSSVVWLVALGALALVCLAAAAAAPPGGPGGNRVAGYAIGLFFGSLLVGAVIRSAWVRLRRARRPDLAVRSPWIAVIALGVVLLATGPTLARNLPATAPSGAAAPTPTPAPTAVIAPSAPTGIGDLLRIAEPYSMSPLSPADLADVRAFYADDPDVRAFEARTIDDPAGSSGLLIVIDVGVTAAEVGRWQSAAERDAARDGLAHERRTLGGRAVVIIELEDHSHLAAWGAEPYFAFLYAVDARAAGAMAAAILEPG